MCVFAVLRADHVDLAPVQLGGQVGKSPAGGRSVAPVGPDHEGAHRDTQTGVGFTHGASFVVAVDVSGVEDGRRAITTKMGRARKMSSRGHKAASAPDP